MQMATAIVRRNQAARQSDRLERAATAKQNQDVALADGEGAEALVRFEAPKAEKALVEIRGTRDIVDVNARFEHTGDARHDAPSKAFLGEALERERRGCGARARFEQSLDVFCQDVGFDIDGVTDPERSQIGIRVCEWDDRRFHGIGRKIRDGQADSIDGD
jgi:hypothetical protein